MTKKSKGLGDSIEKVFKATGIDKVAKKVLGEDCGCQERKEALNKLFPYTRQMTEDEIKIYEDIILPAKGSIKSKEYKILLKIYNKIFNANKKPTSCGACSKGVLDKLAQVYKNSCKNEKPH
jgi:hypothetical protein